MEAAAPLLLVGGGKMGEALLAGWLAGGLPAGEVYVVEPEAERCRRLGADYGVRAVTGPAELPSGLEPKALVLAVKPQVMDDALPTYRERAGAGTIVLSIAAGKPVALFERTFGAGCAVVRAMPNTPAAVGRGTTVLCANAAADSAARGLAEGLMRAVGETHWVEDEELLHAVTALSGGGPAYVFLLIEAMAAAGARARLPAGMAARAAGPALGRPAQRGPPARP